MGRVNANASEDLRGLVERAMSADPDAWEEIYRRSHPRLLAYARRRTSSSVAAEEAVGETMVRALEGIDSFRWQGAGFDAWLFAILRHVVLESYRIDARRERDLHAPINRPVECDGPLDTILHRDEAARVRQAFEQLTAEEQELLELRVVVGLSAEGVAEVLGKRAGAVRMAQHRATARLRALFDEGTDVSR